MVGWRSGGAQISRGPSASTRLFRKHFGPRGPENRSGWQPSSEPSQSELESTVSSNYSLSQFTQPTLTTMVPSHYSPPPTRRARGVYMDGPVFSNKYQSAQPRAPKYSPSKLDAFHPPNKENVHENGHSSYSSVPIHDIGPLMVRNGYAKPKKKGPPRSPPLIKKKRKAPDPPTPYPPEPAADYEGYAPPVPPKPSSILSSSASTSGSIRKKVSIKDELEYIERTDHEKAFAEFKDELIKSAEERAKKGNIEPAARSKAPVEAFLNRELKREIVKAAAERAKRPFVEPPVKTYGLGHVKEEGEGVDSSEHHALSDQLQEELKAEFEKYLKRRKSGSLRMRKNDKNKVLYTALPATSIANVVEKDQTKDWVPEQDLVDDVLDGPVTIQQHTSRNATMPTFFPVFQDTTSDMESIRGQYKKGPGSRSSRTSSRQGSKKKGKTLKSSFKNAWGSLRSLGRRNKLKDIMNDPQWEIYHAQNYDPAPQGPISIHHIESKPAYAYNPHKSQLMLIPHFDKVIVTTDGKHIREDTLTKVAKLGSESDKPDKPLNTEGMTPAEIEREVERKEQMRAEMQFQIVRRQVSNNSEDGFANAPMQTSSNKDYSSLDRLIRRRDNALRANPIYDSEDDEEDDYMSESTDSPEETAPKKKSNRLEDSGYTSNSTPPIHPTIFPPYGLPQVIPLTPNVAMYPGMPVQPQMMPYMVPQWGIPQQQSAPIYQQSLTQPAAYTTYVPQVPQQQAQPPKPASEISMGDRSTTINIAYEPQPTTSPMTVDTSTSNIPSPQISPIPKFRPVKFQPLAKPAILEPTVSVPAPPPPPPPPPPIQTSDPVLPTFPPASPITIPEPTPSITTPPVSYTPTGRTSPHTFTSTAVTTTTKAESKKSQVVPDKEMPTFYRRDFYRKLLQGPVGWKPVSFKAEDHTGSKERYLVDTDFDTNQTQKVKATETQLDREQKNLTFSAKPPVQASNNDINDDLKQEIIKAAEKRASRLFVDPVTAHTNDVNNNESVVTPANDPNNKNDPVVASIDDQENSSESLLAPAHDLNNRNEPFVTPTCEPPANDLNKSNDEANSNTW